MMIIIIGDVVMVMLSITIMIMIKIMDKAIYNNDIGLR